MSEKREKKLEVEMNHVKYWERVKEVLERWRETKRSDEKSLVILWGKNMPDRGTRQ